MYGSFVPVEEISDPGEVKQRRRRRGLLCATSIGVFFAAGE